MKNIYFSFLISGLLFVTACSNAQKKSSNDNKNSTAMYQNVNANDFEKGASQADVVLIDVRTPMEFGSGHIQNAKLMDISSPTFANDIEKLDKSKTYYLYCRSGARSSSASQYMVSKGFTKVYNLSGGIISWAQAQKTLVR
ncbi:MAG: rhodanese-like domain-containing protein [Thermonemataceae bacterium]|nr:rhodanese-like domain-containing protein [Thermonemataceae bacterium]